MVSQAEVKEVNYFRRLADVLDRQKWPVNGRFSPAERAIRKAQKLRHDGLIIEDRDQYEQLLAQLESEIVNNPRNWR